MNQSKPFDSITPPGGSRIEIGDALPTQGKSGMVYHGSRRGQDVFVKIYPLQSGENGQHNPLFRENEHLERLARVKPDSVPHLYGYVGNAKGNDDNFYAVLAMEYIQGETLGAEIDRGAESNFAKLPIMARLRLLGNIVETLDLLSFPDPEHLDEYWLHNDIKPNNVRIRYEPFGGTLVDFGSVSENGAPVKSWSPSFAAPEVLDQIPELFEKDASDQYSFALLSLIVLLGLPSRNADGTDKIEDARKKVSIEDWLQYLTFQTQFRPDFPREGLLVRSGSAVVPPAPDNMPAAPTHKLELRLDRLAICFQQALGRTPNTRYVRRPGHNRETSHSSSYQFFADLCKAFGTTPQEVEEYKWTPPIPIPISEPDLTIKSTESPAPVTETPVPVAASPTPIPSPPDVPPRPSIPATIETIFDQLRPVAQKLLDTVEKTWEQIPRGSRPRAVAAAVIPFVLACIICGYLGTMALRTPPATTITATAIAILPSQTALPTVTATQTTKPITPSTTSLPPTKTRIPPTVTPRPPTITTAPRLTPIPPTVIPTNVPTATLVPVTPTTIPPVPTIPVTPTTRLLPTRDPADCRAEPTPPTSTLMLRTVEFVWIPGGVFTMGVDSKNQTKTPPNEQPAHTVCVSGFWMSKYEISNAQFADFTADGYTKDAIWSAVPGGSNWHSSFPTPKVVDVPFDGARQPRVYVSWYEAAAYAHWLSCGVALPTEAEWEFAARNGSQATLYPWGNTSPSDDKAEYLGGASRTVQTTLKDSGRNVFDVYQLAGNAAEWTADAYADYIAATSINPTVQPGDPNNPNNDRKLTRGGSWQSQPDALRATAREPRPAGTQTNTIGFRVVAHVAASSCP